MSYNRNPNSADVIQPISLQMIGYGNGYGNGNGYGDGYGDGYGNGNGYGGIL